MRQLADIIRNYTPISTCQRATAAARQAYLSATDYHDGSHYSSLTDLTGVTALTHLHRRMLAHPVGCRVLQEKPRIMDDVLPKLEGCGEGTLGRGYLQFMSKYDFKPSGRPLVNHIDDLQLAYVSQRYKEIHDFLHVLLLDQVNVHNELVVKWFEMQQLGLPSAALAVLVSPFLSDRLSLAETARTVRLAQKYRLVLNVYWQEHFDTPLQKLREELSRT